MYEIGPYIIGIAAAVGLSGSVWLSLPILAFFLFFAYPANIYIYGINDIYDYETDRLNPKKVEYESLVMPDEHRGLFKHIALMCAPFIIYAAFLCKTGALSVPALTALIAFFFFAGFYSADPIRAKARPFFDSVFSAGHYVATAVFGYLLALGISGVTPSWQALLACAAAGMCWSISMHAYSAVPDIKADSDAKLQTIATKLGAKMTIALCAILYAASGILSFPYLGPISLVLSIAYVFVMYASYGVPDDKLFSIYKKFPTMNTIVGGILFFIVLFS